MRVIVASRADPVSMNIVDILVQSYGFSEGGLNLYRRGEILLKIITKKHIFADGLAEDLDPELAIVVSSHRSESGVSALLTHPVGNWGADASMGGYPRTLSPTSSAALYISLHALSEQLADLGLSGWRVGLEVTHHGPATRVPTIFIEAGGPPDKLPERRAIEAVAAASLKVAESRLSVPPAAIGFGGGHYAPSFTRLVLEGEYSFGHMCPKYAMPIDRDMVIQAFEKTIERPGIAVLDWKGLKGGDKSEIISILNELGIEWVKA
ncbi:MAG: hypothetical protein NZ918_01660 [Aigarchaeota archaeon]|nr:hypothetical protein [Aigarchaeota archaeon]MDW8021547.1 D-aminoacyl-tRNA deacylase [Nitrososphaerota archaeon]